jgi:hypothetical protein
MSTQLNTQLISSTNYNSSQMVFQDPVPGSVPTTGAGASISYQRIGILTRNPDGTLGELVIPTNSKVFSYGVGENTSPDSGKVNGWSFPLCFPVEDKAWIETFNSIVERCIQHLLDNKDVIDKYDLERSDLKKFNPLYYKKEQRTVNGKKVMVNMENFGPTLYTKLIYSKKNEQFITNFFDQDDNPLDPLTLLGKYCHANAAVKIESIFVGNKISLQVKLYEAVITPIQQGMKRLIAARPEPSAFGDSPMPMAPPGLTRETSSAASYPSMPPGLSRTITSSVAPANGSFGALDDGSDDGSIEDDSPPVQVAAPVVAKQPVKKMPLKKA